MVMRQLILPIDTVRQPDPDAPYREQLTTLLGHDLDFHTQDSGYASHNLHSFPAKFPPQIPRKFIQSLTSPGDLVLDPMMGSGTAVLEALLAGRQGCGFDIDPLAVPISAVKSTPLDREQVFRLGKAILREATVAVREDKETLRRQLQSRWDARTRNFVDYWFFP
ncbi:MAG: DNA methyltransferase [Anaerolineae bacterium]